MDYKNFIFCGLLVCGMMVTAISKPAPDEHSTVNKESLQNDQNDEYDYEDANMPADQDRSTSSSPKSTVLPYFDVKIVRRTVKPGGNITLECPVKNLAEANVILWFKEENTITNSLNVLDNAYQVTKSNFSLIIQNATESFAGNYYCEVTPQNIRMQTILKVTNETTPVAPTQPDLPQIKEAATATNPSTGSTATINLAQSSLLSLALVSTLMSYSQSHRRRFQSLLSY